MTLEDELSKCKTIKGVSGESIDTKIDNTNTLLSNILEQLVIANSEKALTKLRYYDETRTSTSTEYTSEDVFNFLGQNAEAITVANDGIGTLYVKYTSNGTNYSSEFTIYEGESKKYINVHTLKIRASATGINYRVSEYDIWKGEYKNRLEYLMKPNEESVKFLLLVSSTSSIISYYKAPLAPGSTYHAVDAGTGTDMPYTVLPGYELDVIGYWHSCNQLLEFRLYHSGVLVTNAFVNPNQWTFEHNIVEYMSKDFDPNHLGFTIDLTITNRGSGNLEGSGAMFAILRKV